MTQVFSESLNRASEPSQTMFLVGNEGITLREKIMLAR